MKAPGKALLIAAVAFVVLPLAVWVASFLYWHVKITGAIRGLEARAAGVRVTYFDYDPNYAVLYSSGCRCFPYLISGLQSPGNRPLHDELLYDLLCTLQVKGGIPDADFLTFMLVYDPNRMGENDSPEEQRQKAGKIRDWWSAEGRNYHQWWRVWSSNCR